jgi:hypothetical protein
MQPNEQPKTLYHYTSIDSFKSIMNERKIRATRYDQLNDTSEIQIGIQRLLETIENLQVAEADGEYKGLLLAGIQSFLRSSPLEIYVLSFSAAADSLGQWRAYSPNGGVAIGFDFQEVQKGFLCDIRPHIPADAHVDDPIRHNPGNFLRRCQYTDRNGCLDLESLVGNRFCTPNSYPAIFASPHALAHAVGLASLSTMVYQTICSIKHGAYEYEEEWRSFTFRPDPIDYPVHITESNRHYIELAFNPADFVKEVWIGPTGNKESCERAVRHVKETNKLNLAIKMSTIPLRG